MTARLSTGLTTTTGILRSRTRVGGGAWVPGRLPTATTTAAAAATPSTTISASTTSTIAAAGVTWLTAGLAPEAGAAGATAKTSCHHGCWYGDACCGAFRPDGFLFLGPQSLIALCRSRFIFGRCSPCPSTPVPRLLGFSSVQWHTQSMMTCLVAGRVKFLCHSSASRPAKPGFEWSRVMASAPMGCSPWPRS